MKEFLSRTTTGRAISLALLGIALAAIGWYIHTHRQLLQLLLDVPPGSAVILFLLAAATLGSNGLSLKVLAAKYGVELRPREWFGLSAVTTMGNYITPFSGGMVARATYLKQRHAFPYTSFLSLTAANYLIVFGLIGLLGLLSMISLSSTAHDSPLLLLFFAAASSAVAALVFVPSNSAAVHPLPARLKSALAGWGEVRGDGKLVAKLASLTLMNALLGALMYYTAFHALGYPVPARVALVIYLVTSFSLFINLTPGNLGIQEAVAGLSAGMLGAGADLGLLASLMTRAAMVASSFALGPFFSVALTREWTRSEDPSGPGGRVDGARKPSVKEH